MQPRLMKIPSCLFLLAALSFLLSSCATTDPAGGTQVIESVTPYSSLSDSELNAQYLVRLLELQSLNKEMEAANGRKDFAMVNAKAKTGLASAYDARELARQIDDPANRSERLAGIEKIIADLEHLVEITS